MSCVAMIPGNSFSSDSFVFGEAPIGLNDCQNLSYTTINKFKYGTLKISIDGLTLDETNYLIGIDNQSFTLILNPTNSNGLNRPLSPKENIRVDYIKDSSGGGCVLSL